MAKTNTSNAETTLKKRSKLSGQEQVMEFIDQCDHPLKKSMVLLREIVLGANKGITEHIKWNAPSFCFDGEDRVTFNVHKIDCILMVFHRGAKAKDKKGNGPLFKDTTGLLEWVSNDRAIVRLQSIQDVKVKKVLLKKVVSQWIAMTSE